MDKSVRLYDGGAIIIIAIGLVLLTFWHDYRVSQADREFWEHHSECHNNCDSIPDRIFEWGEMYEYHISTNCVIRSDEPLDIKKLTDDEIEKFWQGEDID